jgi:sortase A
MTGSPSSQANRWIEYGLIALGVALLAWCATEMVNAERYQQEQRTALERALSAPKAPTVEKGALSLGSLIGSLDIPRLRLSVMVVEGDDDKSLKKGIGHLPDTPLPWQPGNAAFAGHRDTYFRPLERISAGDEIRLTTPRGVFSYRVREIAIVKPENVSALSWTEGSTLTLITCYPFSFIGNAPKRFVIRAAQVPASPKRRPTNTRE